MKFTKRQTTILSIVVIGIWGAVFYRLYTVFNQDDVPVIVNTNPVSNKVSIKLDTFSISTHHVDPFLKKTIKNNHNSGSIQIAQKQVSQIPIKKPIAEAAMPSIQYLGLVKNSKLNKQVAMLSINGAIGNYVQGEKIGGVEILKIFRDSIQVKFNKNKFFVRK